MSLLSELDRRVIGATMGSYRIRERIGQGGMGAVYLAEHLTLGTKTAIKVLLQGVDSTAESERNTRRFVEEAKSLAKVRHPSLVQIHDAGKLPDGILFIEMEYLTGETLGARIEREHRLPPPLVLSLGTQLAAALKVVHDAGLVHRDIKPSNVFLVPDADVAEGVRAKLLDFGLAQARRNAGIGGAGERSASTAAVPQGTARYMSPEQCESSPNLDGQCDVYALGLLLFESLTGESPYGLAAAEPLQWMYAHVEKRPRRLRELCPDAPAPLDDLIASMLDKLPTQRPDVMEVASQLRKLLSRQLMPRSRPSIKQVAATSLIGIAVGSIVWSPHLLNTWPWAYQLLQRASTASLLSKKQGQLADAAAHTPKGMALIPGQTFTMGSTAEEAKEAFDSCMHYHDSCKEEEFEREAKHRLVTVSSFYLDRFEVTNQQYADFLNKPLRPLQIDHNRIVSTKDTMLLDLHPDDSGIVYQKGVYAVYAGADNQPVVQVTWEGARQYCISLGKRLPTEAEWELAARGRNPDTAPTKWPWGMTFPSCEDVTVARDKGGYCQHLGKAPVAVGTSLGDVTPHGVHDLGGNVREWVADRFAVPYPDCGECVDPEVHAAPGKGPQYRVVRGGNWMQEPTAARAGWRSRFEEDLVSNALGFRCASSVQEVASARRP